MKTSTAVLTLIVLAVLIVGGIYYFQDTEGPVTHLDPGGGPISEQRPLQLEISDQGSALQEVTVTVIQDDRSSIVLDESYPEAPGDRVETFTLEGTRLEEGPFEIRVEATDQAIYNFGAGNVSETTYSFEYDNRAPLISVQSSAHNLNQGGSGLIVYTVSEKPERTGVIVGDLFFPGYNLDEDRYAAFFAMPDTMTPKEFVPRVMATDAAGNERVSGFYYHANPRSFPQVKINISDRFLQTKMPEFEELYPQADSLLEVFLQVNQQLRPRNRQTLHDFARQSAPRMLWDGVFLRQPNAAPMGQFGARRSYYHEGQKIDEQRHLGVDLASVSQAPIMAANDGTVVFADYLGIYGQCIVIDHGLGLQSLYGHLSSIGVHEGDQITKGQVIGNSGASGLAGGDHLHFGMIVSGVPVTPVEWWDLNWLENNVTSKLEPKGD